MERVMPKKVTAVLMGMVLAASLSPALAAPQQAEAADLQPASVLTPQKNTSMYRAKTLKSGKGTIGTFDYVSGTTDFESYWYKFKTSSRRSVYEVRLQSIDGKYIKITHYSGSGATTDWLDHDDNGTRSTSYTNNMCTMTKSDADRGSWLYWNVEHNSASRYDQFKITATEHPLLKRVTGVRLTKKAAKKSLALGWSKQANAKKYQVRYRVKYGDWQYKTVNNNKTTLKKLKSNTKYYVQVRAYHKKGYDFDNSKVSNYSGWSTSKTFKTKK